MANIYQQSSTRPDEYGELERRALARLRREGLSFNLLMSLLVTAGLLLGIASILFLSGQWSIVMATTAGGGTYLLATWLTFRRLRRTDEWPRMVALIDRERFAALVRRGINISVVLYVAGMLTAYVVAAHLETRMASPDLWGGAALIWYKALAGCIALFNAFAGVKMICRALDYNRLRNPEGIA